MPDLLHKLSAMSMGVLNELTDNPRDDGPQAPDALAPTIGGPSGDIPPDKTCCNSIPSQSPPSDSIPPNILAFRTITTILGHIQQERPFAISNEQTSGEERRELRIANALASVAITDRDIVAVVTKRSPEKLQVIACTQPPGDENPIVTPSEPSSFFNPTIGDAKVLAGLEIEDYEKLEEYLDKRWSNSSLARHLYVLSRLLVLRGPSDDGAPLGNVSNRLSIRLTCYVIATCHPKMHRRFEHKRLSKPYIDSLKGVKTFEFKESLRGQPSEGEIENDRLFLTGYVSLLKPGKPITEIAKKVELAKKKEAFQRYTGDTCMEFHALLLELLERFQTHLLVMKQLRGEGTQPAEGCEEFKKHVVATMLVAFGLQRLARGAALQMHLKTIEALLSDPRCELKAEEDEVWARSQNEHDEYLEAAQPSVTEGGAPMPLWKCYRDWLRLMVIHFDAAEVLVRYATSPYFRGCDISLQILVPPPKIRWTLCTTDHKILEFLKQATSSAPPDSQRHASDARREWANGDIEKTILRIQKLENNSNPPGWSECVAKLLANLDMWKMRNTDALSRDITDAIQFLYDSASLYKSLSGSTQIFTGTLHCEACLASLFDYMPAGNDVTIDSQYDKISGQLNHFGRIIGVSKCCCPVCQQLLHLLTTEGQNSPFVIRGSHNTVTACTLPTWIPAHIVDSMNVFFGTQLRRELIDLMSRSELWQNRARSTGSGGLSSDSSEGQAWGDDHPFSTTIALRGGYRVN